MTDKKTDTEDKNGKQKSDGKFIKTFLLVTIIFVGGIYLVMKNRPNPVENIFPNETINTNDSEKDRELVKEALEESYSVGAEPPVLNFAPKENEEKTAAAEFTDPETIRELNEIKSEAPVAKVVNPYESIVESEAQAFNSSALKSQFNDYRFFLSNANALIANYRAEETSDQEIGIFRAHIHHPMHINETIKLLAAYNLLLAEQPVIIEEKPTSMQAKLLAKFIKIKKIDSVNSEILELRSKIEERLEIFTNYLYSQNLQDSFVK
jgi:hypothetical protein